MDASRVLEAPPIREGTLRMDERSAAGADWFDASVASRIDASYRLATVILGDAAEAEDATHDAVVLAWRRIDDLKDRALFDRWFGRIDTGAGERPRLSAG
jgi:DNA-directed RNA polymerase specialized sigma24 family protein